MSNQNLLSLLLSSLLLLVVPACDQSLDRGPSDEDGDLVVELVLSPAPYGICPIEPDGLPMDCAAFLSLTSDPVVVIWSDGTSTCSTDEFDFPCIPPPEE